MMRVLLISLFLVPLLATAEVEITPETVMEYSVEQMEAVVEAFPEQGIPYFALGRVYFRSYQFTKAIEQYEKGLEFLPNDPEGFFMLGLMHEKLNDFEEAVTWYQRAVDVAPAYPNGYERLGRAHQQLGDGEKALEALAKGVEQTPDDASAHYYYAQQLFDGGDGERARTHAERCIELDDRLSEPYYLLSRIERADGNTAGARNLLVLFREKKLNEQQMFDELPQVDDEESAIQAAVKTHMDAFALYATNGKTDEAKVHLARAIELAPDNEAIRVTQLEIAQQEQDAEAMEDALKTLVRVNPNSASYHQLIGLLYSSMKRMPDALVHLEEAVRLDPENPMVLRSFARGMLQGGVDVDKALMVMAKAVEIDPSAESYDLLSWALFANGRGEASLQAMQQAILLDPNNRGYRQRLQTIQQRLQR